MKDLLKALQLATSEPGKGLVVLGLLGMTLVSAIATAETVRFIVLLFLGTTTLTMFVTYYGDRAKQKIVDLLSPVLSKEEDNGGTVDSKVADITEAKGG